MGGVGSGRLPGFKISAQTKLSMSIAKLANPVRYWKGKPRSIETRKKISTAMKGRPTPWTTGVSPSAETRRKISLSHLGKKTWNTGKRTGPLLQATRDKISAKLTGIVRKPISLDTKQKVSENSKRMRREKDPVVAALELQRLHSSIVGKVLCGTKPEWEVFRLLTKVFPRQFVINLNKFPIGGKYPDFICRKHRIVVEMFGIYWHGEKRTGQTRVQQETNRKKHFTKFGYKTVVVWEDEINERTIRRKLSRYLKGAKV